ELTRNDLQERRLARAVRTREAVPFPFGEFHGYVRGQTLLAVRFADIVDMNRGHGGAPRSILWRGWGRTPATPRIVLELPRFTISWIVPSAEALLFSSGSPRSCRTCVSPPRPP